jgi:hypothetical protein
MGNYALPINIDTTYADSGTDPSQKLHQQHHDAIHGFLGKFDTSIGSTVPAVGKVIKGNGTGWVVGDDLVGSGGGGGVNPTDHIMFVSKSGNDANNGLSWGSAKLTINAAITAMSTNQGKIFLGGGTWDETISGHPDFTLIGVGPYDTFIRLTSNGDLCSFVAESDVCFRDLCLEFASSSVTGRLAYVSNAFRHEFYNVRFLGQDNPGQIGLDMDANSGDCHYIKCKFENLGRAHRSITSMSYFDHCHVTSNLTGFLIGDPTDTDGRGGLVVSNTAFIGSGDYYVDVDGSALAVTIDKCWFDGDATTAIKVGKADGTLGPRMFTLINSPSVFGLNTSLLLYKATRVYLGFSKWHHGGTTPPTEISIPNPANVKEGVIIGCRSNQSAQLEEQVPATWEGYRGYINFNSKITGIETTVYNDDLENLHRRIMIRVNGRISTDAQSVIDYPSAFETTQFVKTADSTGFAGMTVGQSSLTIPTGVSGSGIIIIEGW